MLVRSRKKTTCFESKEELIVQYIHSYSSALGKILLAADDIGLTGLWFVGQKYFGLYLEKEQEEKDLPIFRQAVRWLDLYFAGKEPSFSLPLHLKGTPFQKEVWELLRQIPYGQTTTYGAIAKELANKHQKKVSAQAVGGAVGRNEISIMIPCHRVVGTSGSLTGYAGGLDRKIALLKLEKAYRPHFFIPKKTTAP